MKWVLETDENFFNGGPHLYFAMRNVALPPSLGGKPEDGLKHFRMVESLTRGTHLLAKLLQAQFYAPSLAGLPTTLITTAHLDPLRDQGEAYAQRLRAQGVQVRLKRFPATIHDFIGSAKALRTSSDMAVEMLRGVNTRERNASGDA